MQTNPTEKGTIEVNVKDLHAEILRRLEAGEQNKDIQRELNASKGLVNGISKANRIREKRLEKLQALCEDVTEEFRLGATVEALSKKYQRSDSTIRSWIRRVQPELLAPRRNTPDDLQYDELPDLHPKEIYQGGWQLSKKRIVEPTERLGGFTAHRQSLRQGVST